MGCSNFRTLATRRLAVCGPSRFLKASSCKTESQIISQTPPASYNGGSDCSDHSTAFLYTEKTSLSLSDSKELTHVRVDPSCQNIDRCAFLECDRLIWVELSEGLVRIGELAFAHCKSLRYIKIPSTVKTIGRFAFKGCEDLIAVEFCDGDGPSRSSLKKISEGAFSACKSLRQAKIPSSTKRIEIGAFSHCEEWMTVELCDGLKEIKDNAFNGCKSLEEVIVPRTCKAIGNSAFRNCLRLKHVELHDGLKRIEGSSFYGCRSINHIKVPSSVKVLSLGAFHRCDNLVTVELSEGLELIEERAFCSCFQLKRITIPSTVKTIDKFAFYECSLLEEVVLHEGLDQISESAFYGCKSLKSIDLPSSVKVIDKWVFGSCHKLRVVNLPVGLTEIKEGAFWNCKGIKCIQIPCTNRLIGNSSFRGCNQLEEVKLSGGLEQIGISAFSNYDSLKRVTIASPVKEDWDIMAETLCRAGASLEFIKTLLLTQQATFPESSTNWQRVARALTVSCLVRSDAFENFHSIWQGMVNFFSPTRALQELVEHAILLKQRLFPYHNNANWQTLCEDFVNPLKGWWHHEHPGTSLKTFHFLVKCNIPERLSAIGVRKWRDDITNMVETVPPTVVSEMASEFFAIHSKLASYEQGYVQLKTITTLTELALWKSKISQSEELEGHTANERGSCRIKCGADVIIPNVLPYLIGD